MVAGSLYVKNWIPSDDAVRFAGRVASRSVRNEAGDCDRRPMRPRYPTRAKSSRIQKSGRPNSSRNPAGSQPPKTPPFQMRTPQTPSQPIFAPFPPEPWAFQLRGHICPKRTDFSQVANGAAHSPPTTTLLQNVEIPQTRWERTPFSPRSTVSRRNSAWRRQRSRPTRKGARSSTHRAHFERLAPQHLQTEQCKHDSDRNRQGDGQPSPPLFDPLRSQHRRRRRQSPTGN